MPDAKTEVEAMDSLNNDVYSVPINGMRAFPYCEWYIWWETNKVSELKEIYLDVACVFRTRLTEIQQSYWLATEV